MDMNIEKGEPVINYHHDFKFAPIRAYYQPPSYDSLWAPTNFQTNQYCYIKNKEMTTNTSDAEHAKANDTVFTYDCCIEKAAYSKHPITNMMAPYGPPLIHFGVLPVQTNTPLSTTASWAAVCGIWQIEAELEVEFHHSFDYTLSSTHPSKDTYFQPANAPYPGGIWTGRSQHAYGGIQTSVAKLAKKKAATDFLPLMTKNTGKGSTEEEKFVGFNPHTAYTTSGRSDERDASSSTQNTAN